MSSASQGHDFRGWFLHEDNGFKSSPTDSDHKAFGANATIDQAEGTNNAVQVFEPGSRVPIDIIERTFEGSWSASFDYVTPWWMNFIWGSPSTTDNGDGSHTHTWDGEDPQSQQIGIGREGSGKERILKGCVATSATVTPSVGGMVRITLEGAYAEEETTDPASLTSQPTLSGTEVMTFADATLSLGGNTLGYVQQGSLNISNNVELINELGERTGIDFAPRPLVPAVDFQKINEAGETANLEEMYGGDTTIQQHVDNTEAMTMGLDNGQTAGNGINAASFNLTGSFPNSYGEDGLGDPEADLTEQINRLAEGVTADATNEEATAR